MTDPSTVVLENFPRCRILVVGDLMVDRYIRGAASRLSPEAPVPVLLSASQTDVLGGAANVARNIAALGAQCELAGFLGRDEAGEALKELCQAERIGVGACVVRDAGPTTLKTRVLSGNQQLLRIDHETVQTPQPNELDSLIHRIVEMLRLNCVDAIVVSDYAKGVTQPELMKVLADEAKSREIPILVDPKGVDFHKYRGASVIKPNRVEMAELAARWGWPLADPIEAAKQLRVAAALQHVVLTLGSQGLAIVSEQGVSLIPTRASEVYDVTGAGDTVMATLVLGLTSGLSMSDAADLANHAAAVVIAKVGSAAVTGPELIESLSLRANGSSARKVYTLRSLTGLAERWRQEGKRIVFTNGCFDILHAGHVGLFQDARALGDRLIVGVNSDESIQRLKGPGRPLNSLELRNKVLGGLEPVDAIVAFEEDTPMELIRSLRPDVIVKGGDYTRDTIVGAEFVESYGGRVEVVPITDFVSTTKLAGALSKL